MPTPTGMLSPGDLIKHTESGLVCVVTERTNNSPNHYSIKMRRQDGKRFSDGKTISFLLTAPWYLEHGWELINQKEP